jgi:hypothetical protein
MQRAPEVQKQAKRVVIHVAKSATMYASYFAFRNSRENCDAMARRCAR